MPTGGQPNSKAQSLMDRRKIIFTICNAFAMLVI
jgi:hypothetical protein